MPAGPASQPKTRWEPEPIVVRVDDGGFRWGDAGIGAAAGFGVALVLAGSVALAGRGDRGVDQPGISAGRVSSASRSAHPEQQSTEGGGTDRVQDRTCNVCGRPSHGAWCWRFYGSSSAAGTPFGYDRSAPLDLVLGTSKSSDGIVQQELAYRATESFRVKALFVHPVSGGPWPLVIWSPGAGGDRRQELPEAVDLARGGAASLLIDEATLGNCRDAQHEVDLHASYVVSRRRAVDVAETLPNVDTKRIAASGFSRGAAVTAALAGVEHRIHTFVLRSGEAT